MKSILNEDEKIIIVTGGAGLLGKAFCKAIIQQNWTVVIAEKNLSIAENAAMEISSTGNCVPVELDITNEDSIRLAVADIHNKHGRIDALVNNAYPRNSEYGKKMEDVTYESFSENISMNLGGYFCTSKILSDYFKKQGKGNIINIASIYGVIAPKFDIYNKTKMTMPVEYAVIKSGVLHLTKYLSKYLKGSNVRVNAISPGGILDNQPEEFLRQYNLECSNKGMLVPDDLVGSLIFLLSDDSKFINGQNIIVDDGFTT